MTRPAPPAIPLALSCMLVSLIGCGGTRGAPEPLNGGVPAANARGGIALATVQAAARATLAGPIGLEFTLEGSRALGSTPAPVLGSGEFALQRGTGSETIDLGEVAHQEPGTEHVVFLPSRVYLQPKSPTGKVLPPGKAWVSATLAGSDSVDTNFPSFALQAEAVNPELLLSELADGSISAVPLGRRRLNAVGQESAEWRSASAYEVTIDFARALSLSAGPSRAVLGQAIRSELASSVGGSAGSGRGSIRAWVDAHGRVVQLQSAPPGAGVGTATMTLCCFGEAVSVSPPPASQVVDIASLTPSGERENNGGGDSDGG